MDMSYLELGARAYRLTVRPTDGSQERRLKLAGELSPQLLTLSPGVAALLEAAIDFPLPRIPNDPIKLTVPIKLTPTSECVAADDYGNTLEGPAEDMLCINFSIPVRLHYDPFTKKFEAEIQRLDKAIPLPLELEPLPSNSGFLEQFKQWSAHK